MSGVCRVLYIGAMITSPVVDSTGIYFIGDCQGTEMGSGDGVCGNWTVFAATGGSNREEEEEEEEEVKTTEQRVFKAMVELDKEGLWKRICTLSYVQGGKRASGRDGGEC